MGVEIVKAAVVCGRNLSGNAYKVLISMSLQALDKPKDGRPAGLYFGGWGALQNALGYEAGGPETKGHTAVKRAVRELRDGKHITPMVTAAKGNRQSYLVHPGGLTKGVSTDPQSPTERGSEQTLKGGLSRPQKGVSTDPKRGSEQTLLGRTEEGRGLTQDISIAHEPQPQTVDPKAAAHKFEGRPGDDCDECGRAYGNRTAHPLYLLRGGTA